MTTNGHKIPAATIAGVDIERIRMLSAPDAEELERLDALLDTEDGTRSDLIHLCELLAKHGEVDRSIMLLKSNVLDLGDEVYHALRRLHGYRIEEEFDRALFDFQDRFGVKLLSIHPAEPCLWHFMEYYFRIEPRTVPSDIPEIIGRFLRGVCEAEFKYEVDGTTADIGSLDPKIPSESFVILRWCIDNWVIERQVPK